MAPMKILQINLGRRKQAHDLAYAVADVRMIDMVVVAEPNRNRTTGGGWLKDIRDDVAVYIRNRKLEIKNVERRNGWLRIEFSGFNMYCCYISPNNRMEDFKKHTDEIMEDIQNRRVEAIVMGDINAKSHRWGNRMEDARGTYWTEWLDQLNMIVANSGNKPTFERGHSSSVLDVTMATERMGGRISKWEVLEEESLSDHNYIYFEIKEEMGRATTRKEATKWYCRREEFKEELSMSAGNLEINTIDWREGVELIKQIYRRTLRKQGGNNRRKPYWWSMEIEEEVKQCQRKRRQLGRARRTGRVTDEMERSYSEARKSLRKSIKQEKKKKWRDLVDKTDEDVWGEGYKIVTASLRGCITRYSMPEEQERELIRNLFPERERKTLIVSEQDGNEPEQFSMEELMEAVGRMKMGKAPGPDGIPPEIIKDSVENAPELVLKIMNNLLERRNFPENWKRAKAVLLPKEEKEGEERRYRPVCLIDCMGKLLERLICNRLEGELEEKGAISDMQFGFRKSKSTVRALEFVVGKVRASGSKWCVLVALDVKNAFNSAQWHIIMRELRRRRVSRYLQEMIADYLKEREIQTSKGERIKVSAGVPQGSVLGPTLWNVMYDGVLRMRLEEGLCTVAYADDLAVIIEADSPDEVVRKGNVAMEQIAKWMRENGLELAPQKTEMVILKGRRRKNRELIRLSMGETIIETKRMVKYLGVHLDDNLSFGKHIERVCAKAERLVGALNRLLPNVKGPKEEKRRVYAGVVESIMLYAAPIWQGGVGIARYRRMMEGVQRKAIIRAISAYRTIATEGAQVIGGRIPIDLMVEERARIYGNAGENRRLVRLEERRETLRKWQMRWRAEAAITARWTRKIIPDVVAWVQCNHRRTNYYLTQVLSGHGCFKEYTHRIGKEMTNRCEYCGEMDDVEHTVFRCVRWEGERNRLQVEIGERIDTANMVSIMMERKEYWEKIMGYIITIMRKKEEEELRRQRGR